jgi:hypothetical protein
MKGSTVSTEMQEARGENNAHTITAALPGITIGHEEEVHDP